MASWRNFIACTSCLERPLYHRFNSRELDGLRKQADDTPLLYEVDLGGGRVRQYAMLQSLVRTGAQRGTFAAGYGGGWVICDQYTDNTAIPLVLSLVDNGDACVEVQEILGVRFIDTAKDFKISDYAHIGEQMEKFGRLGMLSRLGDVSWELTDNFRQEFDFTKLVGVGRTDKLRIEIPATVPEFKEWRSEASYPLPTSILKAMSYRNTLRAEPTGSCVARILGGTVSGGMNDLRREKAPMLSAYLGALLESTQCPDNWLELPCERWYEHMSGTFNLDLVPPAGNSHADIYLSSPVGKAAFLAQGATDSWGIRDSAVSTIKKFCSLPRIMKTIDARLPKMIEASAVIPYETLSAMSVEDFCRVNKRKGAVPPKSSRDYMAEIIEISGEAKSLVPDETTPPGQAFAALSDAKLWAARPYAQAINKSLLKG